MLLIVCEKVELVGLLHGEAIDDIVALAALITLYSVNCYVVERGYLGAVDSVAYGGDLVSVGHDDAHCLVLVKRVLVDIVDLHYCCRNHFGFHLVGFSR